MYVMPLAVKYRDLIIPEDINVKKILFLIHDLGQGGAEKVLVNLVNNMDTSKFDITVMAMFSGGVNEQFLKKHICYKAIFPHSFRGNIHVMKLFTPQMLHRWFIKEPYDIEISYLEGPSARIISGCIDPRTKLVSWVHIEQHTSKVACRAFRNYSEAARCYQRFDRTIAVSETVRKDFSDLFKLQNPFDVLYNTNESAQILSKSTESVDKKIFSPDEIKLIGVGKLLTSKGFDRLARIHTRLRREGYAVHTYILGIGPEKNSILNYIREQKMDNSFTLLGYETNPYKYVSKCNLFVCASLAEGFSTAATEALIVGTPVCTVEVSGMKEMLGEHNEYGMVTENSEEALYEGIKQLLDDPELLAHYKKQAELRGKDFSTEETVSAVEEMLEQL